MTKTVGRVTHEGRYVIIPVPDSWHPGDLLPPPSLEDRWFESFLPFIGALNKPYDRTPIARQPSTAPAQRDIQQIVGSRVAGKSS